MPVSSNLDDVNSGDVTITSPFDMTMGAIIVDASCCVGVVAVGSGNSIKASVVST